ncbi:MAG: GNAT family N-acetyltransferase [Phenylobacterium sp.]
MSWPVLSTARFDLAPLQPSDRQDLFAHFSDPATVEFMDIAPMTDIAEADETIAWTTRLLDEDAGLRWAIRDRDGGFAGTIGFNSLVREHGSRGEIGYDVVRARWRQGVMGGVLPVVLDHGFAGLGLHRIEATVTPGNAASVALLTRHGFRREGLLRGHGHWKGAFQDVEMFARLAGD